MWFAMFLLQAPEEPDPWEEPLEALTPGTACIQREVFRLLILTHPHWDNYGEDCLNLNIFTPEV